MKSLKLTVLGVLSLALAACGGSIQSKEDAVKVLQRLESMGAGASTSRQGLTEKLFTFGVNLPGESGTASCQVSTDLVTTETSVEMTFDISATMKAFSPDGRNSYDGTESLHYTLSAGVTDTTATGSVSMTVVADMQVAGDYNNHVTADVTVTLDARAIAATSGTVTMTVDGTITADGTTYTYDPETFEIAVGQ